MRFDRQVDPRAWLTVGLLFIVGLLNYLDRIMLTTMRESIVGAIPMTEADFGMLTSVFLWVYTICSPFAGYIADRFKRSRVIICSLLVWSTMTWLTGYATSYTQLICFRALMGISEAFYIPAALALIVDYHRGPTQSLALGLHLAGIMTGQSLGFLGGWIAESYNWNVSFYILGVIGVVYATLLFFLLRDPEGRMEVSVAEVRTEPEAKQSFLLVLKNLFSKGAFVCLLVFWGLLGLVSWMISAWLPTYYQETFNLTQTDAGAYATAYLYPVSIAGAILSGVITDCVGLRSRYARIWVPLIGLLITIPCIFCASYTTVLPLAIVFFMIYGFMRMTVDNNIMPILCMIVDERNRATGYGIINMFSTLIGGAGIYFAGALRDMAVDMGVIYRIASCSLILCVILLMIVKKLIKKRKYENA